MSSELSTFFTMHFVTFLLAEILILVPLGGWFLLRFKPVSAYFHLDEDSAYLRTICERYSPTSPMECSTALMVLERVEANLGYRSLKELRTAALLRATAALVASLFPPLAIIF
jgi:hypothetical protein